MSFKKWLGSTLLSVLLVPFISYAAVPTITSISPDNGVYTGGTVVTIEGSGFNNGPTTVNFGFRPGTGVSILNDNTLTVTAPAGTVGAVFVTVNNADGRSLIGANTSSLFSYTKDLSSDIWTAFVTNNELTSAEGGITTFPARGTIVPTQGQFGVNLNNPEFIAITPDGQRGFVSLADGVYSFDAQSNSAANTPVIVSSWPANYVPHGIAIAPAPATTSGTDFLVYVAAVDAVNDGHLITITSSFTTTTNPTVTTDLSLNSGTDSSVYGAAVTPNSARVLIADRTNHRVFDVALPSTIRTINVGNDPQCIAITPSGLRAFVTNNDDNNVTVLNTLNSPATVVTTVSVGNSPIGVAVTPDGTEAYVANNGSDNVSVIRVSDNTVIATVTVGDGPFGIAISPVNNAVLTSDHAAHGTPLDSAIAFVVNSIAETVQPIATDTHTAGVAVGGGSFDTPQFIAIQPDPAPVAHFTVTPITPVDEGDEITFDASTSFSPVGNVILYFWDFGDGTTEFTLTPVVTHEFHSPGLFNVTLTITNESGTSVSQTFTGQTVSQEGIEPNGSIPATTSNTVEVDATVLPPVNLFGVQVGVKFLTQTDFTNVLTWTLPLSGHVPEIYRVYRNTVNVFATSTLVGTVPGDPPVDGSGIFRFEDHNRTKNVTYFYFVVSIDEEGNASVPASVLVTPL